MSDLLRESLAGQLIRYFTKDKIFKYLEEKEGFQCPSSYARCDAPGAASGSSSILSIPEILPVADVNEKSEAEEIPCPDTLLEAGANEKSEEEEFPGPGLETAPPPTLRTTDTASDSSILAEGAEPTSLTSEVLSRITSRIDLENITTRRDLERAYIEATMRSQVKKTPTQPITPEKTGDGTILVDWYDTDDQENPQNWSFGKKCVVALQI
jgi:DHA1 family multidrug resistance protein-like MFS transporter